MTCGCRCWPQKRRVALPPAWPPAAGDMHRPVNGVEFPASPAQRIQVWDRAPTRPQHGAARPSWYGVCHVGWLNPATQESAKSARQNTKLSVKCDHSACHS